MVQEEYKQYIWTDFYMAFADRLLEYRFDREELVWKILKVYRDKRLNGPNLGVNPASLHDIDPFTVYALFNQIYIPFNKSGTYFGDIEVFIAAQEFPNTDIGGRWAARTKSKQVPYWKERMTLIEGLSREFDLHVEVPVYFKGVPYTVNLPSLFYRLTAGGHKEHAVDNLWDLFASALFLADDDTLENRNSFCQCYNRVLEQIGDQWEGKHWTAWKWDDRNWNITMGLFWIRPYYFMNLDFANRYHLTKRKMPDEMRDPIRSLGKTVPNASKYMEIRDTCVALLKRRITCFDFPTLSIESEEDWFSHLEKMHRATS